MKLYVTYLVLVSLQFFTDVDCWFSQTAKYLKAKTVCNIVECCNDAGIPADTDKLEYYLNEHLFGQHIAKQVVVDSIRAHLSEKQPQKPLTLSFHGFPGSGKNYVTKFIKEALYDKGGQSSFVRHFTGRIHFPLEENVKQYQRDIEQWIKSNVSACARSLFIFDEVDKMPPLVLNIIKPMIDYNEQVDGVDYRRVIFIFMSNTGGELINHLMFENWKKGIKREDLKMSDFEMLVTRGAFNEKGGFQKSDTIKSNLIDHFVPFLPMEKTHVEQCIKEQFKMRQVLHPKVEHIDEALDFIQWGPEPEQLYSKSGCKRLSQKVAMLVAQHYYKRNKT